MNLKKPDEYQLIPGRGLLTQSAIDARINYLKELGFSLDHITRYFTDHSSIQNKIESFIGTVEIPLGIVGPLLFNDEKGKSYVYTAAGTLEGALIASMNRGAKAISLSNGFTAKVIHQKMIRAPLFMLQSMPHAMLFDQWITANTQEIKNIAERYSNHAKLLSVSTDVIGTDVHVKFVYSTGDASGQNMTTTCTWHAMLWMVERFLNDTNIEIPYFVIEGNGASDKKASQFLIDHGRGVCVIAKCFLSEDVIQKVLRTTSNNMIRCFGPSVELSKKDGMLGYNINVANAIAAIFVATGQDLASVHESAIGILDLKKKENGLMFQLTLPSLVIGTVGGGTNIEKQNEALQIMDCAGNGKIERFAKLIAGFALSLEISTYAAIVSGEFAKAHEKLGRNKPKNWLLRHEVNEAFIKNCLKENFADNKIIKAEVSDKMTVENGIITNITQRISKKITGFLSVCVLLEDNSAKDILIKSKALDIEVIKGLHLLAASIDPQLSDLLYQYRENLEYWESHIKELILYKELSSKHFQSIPAYNGDYVNKEREIYLIFIESLRKEDMLLIDSENSPALWTEEKIKSVINSITEIHLYFSTRYVQRQFAEIPMFEPWNSVPLYKKMADILLQESDQKEYALLMKYGDELEQLKNRLQLPHTIIHNDFNPRNVAIRKNGTACIYDWELAVKNIPHRDIAEFLCFCMQENFSKNEFISLLEYHYQLWTATITIDWETWVAGYIYALKEFLVTRSAFYKVSEILMKLKFCDRIMQNGFRMIKLLEENNK